LVNPVMALMLLVPLKVVTVPALLCQENGSQRKFYY
jgi:hypothetical protein